MTDFYKKVGMAVVAILILLLVFFLGYWAAPRTQVVHNNVPPQAQVSQQGSKSLVPLHQRIKNFTEGSTYVVPLRDGRVVTVQSCSAAGPDCWACSNGASPRLVMDGRSWPTR
jgi:hypothetical protein